jgi:hypothetical protein
MKGFSRIATSLLALSLVGCATHQGSDGKTYYWLKPIPINSNMAAPLMPSATTTFYQVNGTSYTVTTFSK